MKKVLLTALAAASVLAASAVPAKRVPRTFTQSDGSQITVTLVGDEFNHSYVTDDGLTVAKAANGDFYYRTAQGVSRVMAHNSSARSASESAFVAAERGTMTLAARAAKADARRKAARRKDAAATTEVPQTGTVHIPVVLVNYSDIKFKDSDPKAVFTAQLSKGSTSAHQYFIDQSRGKFDPQFDVLGPVTLDHSRSYYGANDDNGDDLRVGTMVRDAFDKIAASGVNLKQYDNNGDNMVDVAIVLYAGVGEASSNEDNSIWPCQWSLSSSDAGAASYYNGVKVDRFAVFNELNGGNTSKVDGIGTFCHEFSHCLGLPDFYDVNYSSPSIYGMGSWSLLDYGSYNNDGYTPCNYTAYEREFMGWDTIPEPAKNHTYLLKANGTEGANAYKVVNDANANEYYILENRQQQGWDKYLASSGMMVTHVDYSARAWNNNSVNTVRTHQRMTIIPADNKQTSATESGDLFPYGGVTELTDESVPAAKVYTGNFMGKPITGITTQDDMVSFTFMKEAIQKETPVLEPTDSTKIQSTAFTASWTSVPNVESYTLYVGNVLTEPKYKLLLTEGFSTSKFTSDNGIDISSKLDTYMDNTGWTGPYIYNCEGSAKFGSSKKVGKLVSPKLSLGDADKVTVVFKANAYGSDTGVKFTVSAGSDSKEYTLTSAKDTYTAVLSAKGNVNVTFANAAAKKRAELSSVAIYSGNATEALAPVETGNADRRVITGITDTTYTVSGLTQDGSYVYKVKAVYTDGDSSKWSEPLSVTLITRSGIEQVSKGSAIVASGRTVVVEAGVEGHIYGLAGREISPEAANRWTLAPGIYVVKAGTETRKLIVR